MIDRREVVGAGVLLALLGACTPSAGAVTVVAQGGAGMNPGPDGADRPLTLQIVQLRSGAAFQSADFFALQSPTAALGADLVKADVLVLSPGARQTKSIALDPATAMIGVIAGFRTPAGRNFRALTPVSATDSITLSLTLGPAGLALVPA